MKFWDTSAIIPLCIEQPQTTIVKDFIREDNDIIAWWGTIVECYSAFARLRREGFLEFTEETQVKNLLSFLSNAWSEIEPSEEIKEIAGRILLNHPLSASDSLQLAAALVWVDKSPKGHYFVCFDNRLREAARKEGFLLLP